MRTLEQIIVRDRAKRNPPESRLAQAKRIGYSEGALRLWESGRAFPPLNRRAAIARIFEISEARLNKAIEHDRGMEP